MRLFSRVLLGHVAVVAALVGVLLLAAELSALPFIQHHVQQMTALLGAEGTGLRADLSQGMRATLTRALLSALPPSLLVAAVTAWVASRRVTASVRTLQEGSAALASGEYSRRLPETGRDELAELAQSFNTLAGTLAGVEQARVELIGTVAHELRAPVAAVRGYVEAAQDGLMEPARALPAIARELGHLERLARDLSLVSRVEAGQVECTLRALELRAALAPVLERFEVPFDDRQVRLRVDLPVAPVRLDPERAAQVLTNLLSNALRHTAPGGQVSVGAAVLGTEVHLRVADSGTGIAPEHLNRVFERFFRADAARTRGEGSGVGLTVARGLARAMGGDLNVDSRVGEGSVFTWVIPSGGQADEPA